MSKTAVKTSRNRRQLIDSFDSLKHSFDGSLQHARDVEAAFEAVRRDFITRISRDLHATRKRLPENNPVREEVMAFIDLMERTSVAWDAKVAGREKGIAFRAHFEDSLLVFVNGKVKSGKSSLGNYMAWGDTDPSDEQKDLVADTLKPRFFSHAKSDVAGGDGEKEAELRREFRVGATEATSSIQGFSLPGLTWVDSPGMHSLNIQNEQLARDYVEHADLILYTIKSDSAGRESDLVEIAHLLGKGKRILLLLTGSDDMEEELGDDGESLVQTWVMKDEDRRMRQRTYVRDALVKNYPGQSLEDVGIISFSARYAQLHADDADAYKDSGMGDVCGALSDLCLSEGLRIKQRTPLNNLSNFLQSCSDDLQPYQALIDGFRQPLTDLKAKSSNSLNVCIQQGQSALAVFIDDFFETGARARDDAADMRRQLAAFQAALNVRYQEIAAEQLGRIFSEVLSGFDEAVHATYSNSELVRLHDFELETATEKVAKVRSGTRKRNTLIGTALGGLTGFLLGGPAGAAIGASLAGGVGGAMGDSASTQYDEIVITVGDNWLDIRHKALASANQALQGCMRTSAARLWHLMDRDVEQILAGLTGEIATFDKQVQKLLHQTKMN